MEDCINILGLGACLLLYTILVWCYGFWANTPDELENGCITYDDKVYCEEINMEE